MTIVQQIVQILNLKFGATFNQYYDGDPDEIPISALPCIVVDIDKTSVKGGPTGMDILTHTVIVKIILNKADDYGQDPEHAVTKRRLRSYAAGQLDDKSFDTASLMGILRTDLTMSQYLTNSEAEIEYATRFIPNAGALSMTAEAWTTFTCTEYVPVARVPRTA